MLISVVLGGAGFIGSHLVEKLVELGRSVIVVDNFSTGLRDNLSGMQCEVIEADCREELPIPEGVDEIYNLATCSDTPWMLENPEDVFEASFFSTKLCIEYLTRNEGTRLFFASSSEVFGLNTADLSEFSPGIMKQAEIRHAYAEGKRIAEIYLAHFAQRCGWDRVSIGRFFDVFGERAWRPRMITNFVTRALRGEDVVLYGDGEQYRNPTYVKDVCDAVCICIERGGIYNIASQTHMRVKDVVSKISEIVGDVRIRFGDALPCDTRRRVAKTDTIRRAGWSEKYGFNEGLRRTVQWWKDGEKYNLVRW